MNMRGRTWRRSYFSAETAADQRRPERLAAAPIVQTCSHPRQRQHVDGVITAASVSITLPPQEGHTSGRADAASTGGSAQGSSVNRPGDLNSSEDRMLHCAPFACRQLFILVRRHSRVATARSADAMCHRGQTGATHGRTMTI